MPKSDAEEWLTKNPVSRERSRACWRELTQNSDRLLARVLHRPKALSLVASEFLRGTSLPSFRRASGDIIPSGMISLVG
jgi:hypothetical protein